jgi:hypothetical protein
MSYFEFVFNGILTPVYEEKSNEILNEVNKYYVPYVIHKFIDEDIEDDKKKRTIILHSHINVIDMLSKKFINCGLDTRVYWKQQII